MDNEKKPGNPFPNKDISQATARNKDRITRLNDGRVEIEFAHPLEPTEITPEMLAILGHRYGNQLKFDLAKRLVTVRTYPEDWLDVLWVMGYKEDDISSFKIALSIAPLEDNAK